MIHTSMEPNVAKEIETSLRAAPQTVIDPYEGRRITVPNGLSSWSVPFPEYLPPYFDHPNVIANDCTRKAHGWADPQVLSKQELCAKASASFVEGVFCDSESGRPLNPAGRTGLAGRGLWGKWGPNFAADPVAVRHRGGGWEVLLIQRNSGVWAIPGGMVDAGEIITTTLLRELQEETSLTLASKPANILYRGYCDDPRNTDNAWAETTAALFILPQGTSTDMLKAQSDAQAYRWMKINDPEIATLYASHPHFIRLAAAVLHAPNE